MQHSRWSLIGWAVGATLVLGAGAQADTSEPSAFAFLLQLPGDLVTVRYTPGSLDRAAHVQERFDRMVKDFKSWSRSDAVLVVYLLSRDEWQQGGYGVPYGFPEPLGGRGLALCAWGDERTVQLWRDLLGGRPPVLPGQPLRGSPEQAASLAIADLMAVVEAARTLLVFAGYSGEQAWVDGVLTHAVALSVLQRHESTRLPEVRQIFAGFVSQGGGPGALSLAEASQAASLRDRLWFEGQLFAAANLMAEAGGKAPAGALLKWARKSGGTVSAAALLGRYPQLGRWLNSAFAED